MAVHQDDPNLADGARTVAEGKRHFIVLDALRGIAALFVGCLHMNQIMLAKKSFGHAYLAVDFFFCLSGFVVAYAYEARLRGDMSLGDFVLRRVIRLWPLIVIGSALGTIIFLGGEPKQIHFIVRGLFLGAMTGLLLPGGLIVGGLSAYPVNNPIWSLFFESLANLAYGAWIRTVGIKGFKLLLAPALIALIWAAVVFGSVHHIGSDDWPSFIAGVARVAFPFLIGVVIYQGRWYDLRRGINVVIPIALLVAALAIPEAGGWLYDLVCIVIVFPVIVIIGANAEAGVATRVFILLGEVSYPFYLIHQPIIRAMKHAMALRPLSHVPPSLVAIASLVGIVLVSIVISRTMDIPIRKSLTRVLLTRKAGYSARLA